MMTVARLSLERAPGRVGGLLLTRFSGGFLGRAARSGKETHWTDIHPLPECLVEIRIGSVFPGGSGGAVALAVQGDLGGLLGESWLGRSGPAFLHFGNLSMHQRPV